MSSLIPAARQNHLTPTVNPVSSNGRSLVIFGPEKCLFHLQGHQYTAGKHQGLRLQYWWSKSSYVYSIYIYHVWTGASINHKKFLSFILDCETGMSSVSSKEASSVSF